MPDIFDINMQELKKFNVKIFEQLNSIKTNEKFEVFQGDSEKAINILHTTDNTPLYDNPIEDYHKKKEEYEKFREYPFMYIFGIGNGNEINFLLQNSKLERVVLIEPEVEILYIVFHLIDFSSYIKSAKIVFLLPSQVTFELAIKLFGKHKSRFYAKVYDMHVLLPFYENYEDLIITSNETLTKAINHVISFSGNDVTDNLIGIKHHIQNIPTMLKNGKFSELITKKNSNIAIIVSTGPSLNKQLELLKKIQTSVTIISVDASLPILEKHDIKPDIVTSIERVALTSKFFKNTSAKFQKNIVFLSVSLQHKDTLEAIKGKKALVMRPFNYNRYFKLDDYGYLGYGMSSANLAHELAIQMKYKKIVLIGQDLAFAKDGKSHSENHIFGVNDVDKKKIQTDLIEGYGGDELVASSPTWILFKNSFEQIIETLKDNVETINATEGGARIKGSVELTFKEVIDKYVDTAFKKEPIAIEKTDNRIYKKQIKQIKKQINSLIRDGEEFSRKIEESFLILYEETKKLENITEEEALEKLSVAETLYLIQEIENIRTIIEEDTVFNAFYYDFAQSDLLHTELNLATIKVRYVDNAKDNQKKAIQWILLHRELLFTIAGTVKNSIDILKQSKNRWDT